MRISDASKIIATKRAPYRPSVSMRDLFVDARLLVETVRELDRDVDCDLVDIDAALWCFVMINDALQDLAGVKRILENKLGAAMVAKWHVVTGLGTFERTVYRPGRHRCIDEEGLWRALLKTRVVTADGEILSDLDIVVRAYGSESRESRRVRLTGASPMKIEALGLDPAAFFERSPRAGWKIQVFR
jgi:hypothetical protein